MEEWRCLDTYYSDFFLENKDRVEKLSKILAERRSRIPVNIYPTNYNLLDSFRCVKLKDLKAVLVLPHPYKFDSGTGIPCMVKNNSGKIPSSLIYLQKATGVRSDNFDKLWSKGVMLLNIALTEEEDFKLKIPHEVFWSAFFEKFIKYLCDNTTRVTFYLSGATSSKYRDAVDQTNDHVVKEIPVVSSPDFPKYFVI